MIHFKEFFFSKFRSIRPLVASSHLISMMWLDIFKPYLIGENIWNFVTRGNNTNTGQVIEMNRKELTQYNLLLLLFFSSSFLSLKSNYGRYHGLNHSHLNEFSVVSYSSSKNLIFQQLLLTSDNLMVLKYVSIRTPLNKIYMLVHSGRYSLSTCNYL